MLPFIDIIIRSDGYKYKGLGMMASGYLMGVLLFSSSSNHHLSLDTQSTNIARGWPAM